MGLKSNIQCLPGADKIGEQVMVDGFQKLRGNAPVKAVPWQPAASGAAAAPAAASAPASAASR